MTSCARVRLLLLAALALGAGALAPGAAQACTVCLTQDSALFTRALLKGTALLALTPMAVIGFAVWYLLRRARAIEAAEAARRAADEAAPPGARATRGAARPA